MKSELSNLTTVHRITADIGRIAMYAKYMLFRWHIKLNSTELPFPDFFPTIREIRGNMSILAK